MATVGTTAALRADFGSGLWDGGPIGIPYVVVPANQPKVRVTFDDADESDPYPYPVPKSPPIEGGPSATGDRHVLIVDQGACVLYELYDAHPTTTSAWTAGSGAVCDLRSNACARPGGPPPMPRACRSYRAWSATTRWRPARSTTPSA